MTLRQHSQEVHWIEQPAAEPIVAGWHDCDIDVAAFESAGQAGATVLDQMNLDANVALAIARQKLRKKTLDRLRGSSEAQDSDFPALKGTRPLAERCHVE